MINLNYILLGFTLLISAYIVYVSINTIVETRRKYYKDFMNQRNKRKQDE